MKAFWYLMAILCAGLALVWSFQDEYLQAIYMMGWAAYALLMRLNHIKDKE